MQYSIFYIKIKVVKLTVISHSNYSQYHAVSVRYRRSFPRDACSLCIFYFFIFHFMFLIEAH